MTIKNLPASLANAATANGAFLHIEAEVIVPMVERLRAAGVKEADVNAFRSAASNTRTFNELVIVAAHIIGQAFYNQYKVETAR